MRPTVHQLTRLALCALLAAGCSKSPSEPASGDPGSGGDPGGGDGGGGALDQDGAWMWANPKPQGSPLSRVRFATDRVAYAIGASGAVLKSSDAGATWEMAYAAFAAQALESGYLYGLHFLDAARGWVVGTRGQVARTLDGGATWTDQSVGGTRDVNGVWFLDGSTGFVCGDRGLLMRTDDGGATWSSIATTAGNTDLGAIAFATPAIGWVGGDDGYVLYTDDAGDTWEVLDTNWSQDVVVASPSAPDQVVFGTAQGLALTSVSPGQWQGLLSFDRIQDVNFTDTQNGLVIYLDEDETYLGKMTNGVWGHELLDFPQAARSIARSGDDVVAVGWWGIIQYSANGGASWTPAVERIANVDPYTTQLWDVAFADETLGLTVGTAGTVLRTTDGGLTWSVESSGVDADLWAVTVTGGGHAVAVGDGGTMIHSPDGGMTWNAATYPPTTERFSGVSMWDDMRGIAVGVGTPGVTGSVFYTQDGGATWAAMPSVPRRGDPPAAYFDVWAAGDSLACVALKEGEIARTTDAGLTWTIHETESNWAIQCVQLVDELHGFASAREGDIIRTTDGGQTWDILVDLPYIVDDIHFATPMVGLAVGPTGTVLGTTDGGETWTAQVAGMTTWNHARAVWMATPTDGVVVGTETDILYTRSAGWNP